MHKKDRLSDREGGQSLQQHSDLVLDLQLDPRVPPDDRDRLVRLLIGELRQLPAINAERAAGSSAPEGSKALTSLATEITVNAAGGILASSMLWLVATTVRSFLDRQRDAATVKLSIGGVEISFNRETPADVMANCIETLRAHAQP